MGWKIIIIWECELKKSCRDVTLEHLLDELNSRAKNDQGLSPS